MTPARLAARQANHLHPGCSADLRDRCRSDAGGARNLRSSESRPPVAESGGICVALPRKVRLLRAGHHPPAPNSRICSQCACGQGRAFFRGKVRKATDEMKKTHLAISALFLMAAGSMLAQNPPSNGQTGTPNQTQAPGQKAGQRNGKKAGPQDGSGPMHQPGSGGGTGGGQRRGRR